MNVTNKEMEAFDKGFHDCMERIGGGKVAADTTCVRRLVRLQPQIACRFVEIHCFMAQSQPGYLQPALMVAGAYQVEFNDDCLMKMVLDKAKDLKAEDHLARIRFAPDMDSLSRELPERTAAREWWRSSVKEQGHCDNCSKPIRRGEGYLISGRQMMMGEHIIDLGKELVCRDCFDKISRGED
ncbi:MAG: hypothetical protein NTU95_11975 [Methanothrix sp.]|nr:hypothetical protein [Methanothrix sp.]